MKKFNVTMPVCGVVFKTVEAETEQEAIDKVYDGGFKLEEIEEVEMYDKINKGNVCYVTNSSVDVEEV